jgi:hypothetical protein
VKAAPKSARGNPGGAEGPGELRALGGLNSRRRVADSCVEQNPGGGGCFAGFTMASFVALVHAFVCVPLLPGAGRETLRADLTTRG